MALEYFCCYHSYRRKVAKLSDQEVGRLFRALLEYSESGEAKELAGRESVAFDFIADDIDRQKRAYQEKCEQSKKNASKRWDAEDAAAYDGMPTSANDAKTKTKTKTNTLSCAKADAFAAFWAAYPKKKNKADAEKAFMQVSAPLGTLLAAIEAQKKSPEWQKDSGQFIPYPATWLRRGAWMDETGAPASNAAAPERPQQRWVSTGEFEGYWEVQTAAGDWVRRV